MQGGQACEMEIRRFCSKTQLDGQSCDQCIRAHIQHIDGQLAGVSMCSREQLHHFCFFNASDEIAGVRVGKAAEEVRLGKMAIAAAKATLRRDHIIGHVTMTTSTVAAQIDRHEAARRDYNGPLPLHKASHRSPMMLAFFFGLLLYAGFKLRVSMQRRADEVVPLTGLPRWLLRALRAAPTCVARTWA